MKNIPIVILNKDRLDPLKKLVNVLQNKNYNNIIIVDNRSTYLPLLNWYETSKLNIFYNNIPETLFDTGTLHRLAYEVKHHIFTEIVKDYFIFTDSDVVPIDEIPDNFVEDMIYVLNKYNKHKIGLGLKIDDLPIDQPAAKDAIKTEAPYWDNKVEDKEFDLYAAPIDTTFAVYAPNSTAGWSANCLRMGGKYIARHMPWYYDINNLPEDEYFYLKHLEYNKGPVYSIRIKGLITSK